jgi:hypothetical protein
MKKLAVLFSILICFTIQAKEVYLKGRIANDIRVSAASPLPQNRCTIYCNEVGNDSRTAAKPYVSEFDPEFIARITVSASTEFVLLEIESPGYNIYTKHVSVVNSGDRYIADIGVITLVKDPECPFVEDVILSKNSNTQCLNYKIYLKNPTNKEHTFKNLKIKLYVKHDFSSAGLSSSNDADLKYKIDDRLYLHPAGKVVTSSSELVNDPDYEVPVKGHMEFFKNKGLIMIELNISTHIRLTEQGDNYVQIELPKKMKIDSSNPLVDDPMFEDGNLSVISFTMNNMSKTILEFKSTEEKTPTISYEKKH